MAHYRNVMDVDWNELKPENENYGDHNSSKAITGSENEKDVNVKLKILYFGTPVVLISSLDREGNVNLSPMSSAWALGYNVVLGLSTIGKTFENLDATRELTLNFPDKDLWKNVEKLAPLTGKNPVPPLKIGRYKFESDKFRAASLTAVDSDVVRPPLVEECPLKMEAVVKNIYALSEDNTGEAIVQASVVKVHASKGIVLDDEHIDPMKWKPLIYSFRHYFSLGEQLGKNFKSET